MAEQTVGRWGDPKVVMKVVRLGDLMVQDLAVTMVSRKAALKVGNSVDCSVELSAEHLVACLADLWAVETVVPMGLLWVGVMAGRLADRLVEHLVPRLAAATVAQKVCWRVDQWAVDLVAA